MMSKNATAQIQCTNHSHFLLNSSQYVHISNVEFVGCGGNQVENVNKLVLRDATFIGNKEAETALELIDTAAEIVNCTFTFNGNGDLRCVQRDLILGCIVDGLVGGAMKATHSEINISQSMFENNEAVRGAALFAEQQSVLNVKNSTFIKNRGTLYAVVYSSESTITIEASEFDSNHGKANGGVLYSQNSHITIAASEFSDNSGGFSGAVLLSESSHIKIETSEFYNNTATIWGGVFYFNLRVATSQLKQAY